MILSDLFRSMVFYYESPILFRRIVFFPFFLPVFIFLPESDLWFCRGSAVDDSLARLLGVEIKLIQWKPTGTP